MFKLFYAYQLVGLQGEPPLRVALDVLYAGCRDGCIAPGVTRVAGLQVEEGGGVEGGG